MKTKRILLTLVLCCCSVFALLGFAGCGEVSLGTLNENFQKLDAKIASYSQIFVQKSAETDPLQISVKTYGNTVDGYITSGDDSYAELKNLYGTTLEIANEYVQANRAFILNLDEGALSKTSKNELKNLNASLQDFTNSIDGFVKAHVILTDHFATFAGKAESDLGILLRFKKSYGDMVKKCVTLSSNTAKMVESTEIFEILKKTTPTERDTETILQYIRAKTLPIFSEFKITEISNKMNWASYLALSEAQRGDTLKDLVEKLDTQFASFRQKFLETPVKNQPLTSQEMNGLFDLTEIFFVEMDSFLQALYDFNISKVALATQFNNNLQEYLQSHQFANTRLQKLEQFVGTTLPNFINTVSNKVVE